MKKNNKEINVLGDGNQTRQYLHFSDCLDALINIPFRNNLRFEVYNLAGEKPITVKIIINYIIDELKLERVKINYENKDR